MPRARIRAGIAPVLVGAVVLSFLSPACAIDDRALTVREPAIVLLPDATGFVAGTNDAGIFGSWSNYVDTPICVATGYGVEQCSYLDGTNGPGSPAHPIDLTTGRLCTSGVAAQVLVNPTTMQLDYGSMWGAGLQLQLNGDAPYDAPAHGITGFAFEIDSPPPTMRVNFTNPGSTADPYWGGAGGLNSPVRAGVNVFQWADVAPTADSGSAPLNPHALVLLQFHVTTSTTEATPFDFCVWNLTALAD